MPQIVQDKIENLSRPLPTTEIQVMIRTHPTSSITSHRQLDFY